MAPESLGVPAHELGFVVSTLGEDDQAFRYSHFDANVREEEALAF